MLTTLPRLTALNLHRTTWTEDAVRTGLSVLAAGLPCLRMLNAPDEALVRTALYARALPSAYTVTRAEFA
jgi:hypothetical protein